MIPIPIALALLQDSALARRHKVRRFQERIPDAVQRARRGAILSSRISLVCVVLPVCTHTVSENGSYYQSTRGRRTHLLLEFELWA